MRDFLAFCTLMACLFVFIASLIAVFRPLPKLRLDTRKRAFAGMGLAFVLFVLTGAIIPPPEDQTASTNDTAKPLPTIATSPREKQSEHAPEKEASLAMTPDVLAERFNALASKGEKPWRIRNLTVKDTSFKYMLNDHLGIVGTVREEDKDITGLIMLGSGAGSFTSGVDVFMAMSMLYCSAAGQTDLKQCGPTVFELMKDFEDGDDPRNTTINNLDLTYSRSAVTGNMFSISPTS